MLDASAALELLLNSAGGELVAERIADRAETLHAPHLLSVEVAQVLRRYVRAGSIAAETGAAILVDLADLDIEGYAHELFLDRVWELREYVTAYDAVYLALAEILACPLLTFDARLASVPGHNVSVEILEQ